MTELRKLEKAKQRASCFQNICMNNINALIKAEARYINVIRKHAGKSVLRSILERETHDAINKYLTRLKN